MTDNFGMNKSQFITNGASGVANCMSMAPPKVRNPKRSAKYYRENPEARRKKAEYDTKFQSKPSQKKAKRERAKYRRDKGIMGKGGKDASHTKSGRIVLEDASKNRARNRGKK